VFHFWGELVHLIDPSFGSQEALTKLVISVGFKSSTTMTGLNETLTVVLALIDGTVGFGSDGPRWQAGRVVRPQHARLIGFRDALRPLRVS
jgi:hypothetical protein